MLNKMKGCAGLAFGLMILVLNATARPSNDVPCKDPVFALMPCELFFVGYGPTTPNPDCCQSAQDVLKQADTTEKRRVLCDCFKHIAKAFDYKSERAKQFPQLCKIDSRVPIDPDVDCNL